MLNHTIFLLFFCFFHTTDDNFDIIIYDSNNHEVFKQHIDSLESNNLSIDLKGLKGKKVRISLRNAGIPLSLAEVEVYTYK
ncbi:exported glycosyl hydrolase [Streptococcus pneumoniae]|nr:exported glycosyl hydrolase [Streptococcus pneumoniae]